MVGKPKPADEPRSGVYTSEFGLTALVIVAATVLRAIGSISDEMWAAAALGGSASYTASRAYLKR